MVDMRLAQRKLRAPLLGDGGHDSACMRKGPRRRYPSRALRQACTQAAVMLVALPGLTASMAGIIDETANRARSLILNGGGA